MNIERGAGLKLVRAEIEEVLPRSCMRDHIRKEIVARILDGRLQPGAHLREMALAGEFEVSQAPVREALRELEALGLLESKRYCGTRVRSIDLDELREAYELRMALEESAVRLAVPCVPADLEYLEQSLLTMQRCRRHGDTDAYMGAAIDYHRHLVQMSRNRLYLRAWEHMAWDIRARLAVQRIGLIGTFMKERREIISALRAGDGERAAQLLRGIFQALLVRLEKIRREAERRR